MLCAYEEMNGETCYFWFNFGSKFILTTHFEMPWKTQTRSLANVLHAQVCLKINVHMYCRNSITIIVGFEKYHKDSPYEGNTF